MGLLEAYSDGYGGFVVKAGGTSRRTARMR